MIVVLAIAGIPLVASFFNLATPFIPYGRFGFRAAGDGTVTSVERSSPAAEANIKPGDRLDVAALTPQQRVYAHWTLTLAGKKSEFLFTKGPARSVTLVARRYAAGFEATSYFASFALLALIDIATTLIAVAVVFRAPSRMTWAFLVDAVGSQIASLILVPLASPAWVAAYSMYYGILGYLACGAFVVFALRFPSDRVAGIGRVVDRWAMPLAGALAIPVIVANVGVIYRGLDSDGIEYFLKIVSIAFYAVAMAIFIARYYTEHLYERSRMAWVIASFLVGYAGIIIVRIVETMGFAPPRDVTMLLLTLKVLVPIAIAYAILKQRIISVRFFLNQAVIVAAIALISLGSIALLDWLVAWGFHVQFSNRGAVLFVAADMAAAVLVAICMPALYRATRNAVDRTFFRREYAARQKLLNLAQRFAAADSAQTMGQDLVRSIVGSLEVGSAAVFARGNDGAFAREAAEGWTNDEVLEHIDAERLADAFEKRRGPLPFTDVELVSRRIPSGDASPVVGFPIFVRGRLSRFVLFSGHPYGLELDPSEKRLLGEVTRAASHGFARLSQL
ncbi:MAG: hypothetical protein JO078_08630 [Candidatus Eremiobacteraeota bacterium]|nr:hypothetical protein [Candidatus Eremiobacteraeota bacterium]MBV9700175.1 hypothetical protein [Candidatus Eremiobacteraeota bacterium]